MSKKDNHLIQSLNVTIKGHTFNIARMPAIVAVNVVKKYSLLNGVLNQGNINERRYMRANAGIVQYVLRNLILDDPSFVDRFRMRIAALLITKRAIVRMAKEDLNNLIDSITTVALGDKKKEIEVQDKAYKAMIKELGVLSQRELEQLFASLQPSLEQIRRDYGSGSPSKKSSTIGK